MNLDFDKNAHSMSLLRYQLIFCTNGCEDHFLTEEVAQLVHEYFWNYFHPLGKDHKYAHLNSIRIHPHYVEVEFQALPTLTLTTFINNLKSVTATHILKILPGINSSLWNRSYAILTKAHFTPMHLSFYLQQQETLAKNARLKKLQKKKAS